MRRTELARSTYRTLASDEPDPEGEPLVYATSDGRTMRRWKVAPRTYVERVVRDENGRPMRSRPMVAKRIDRAEARRRYEAGESLRLVAQAMGCTGGQLSRALRQEGVEMRPAVSEGAPFNHQDTLRRYRAGEGHVSIARRYGVSVARVKAVLRQAGVEVRGAGRVSGVGPSGGPVGYDTEFKAMRPLVRLRSRGRCEAEVSDRCSGVATHVHHRKLRSQGGTNDLANLLDVCLWCHSAIHSNPERSYAAGLLLRSTAAEVAL